MLYLDTANLEQIKKASQVGIIQGVTTNPTILLKENVQRETIVKEILKLTDGTVFVQTEGETVQELITDAEEILSAFKDPRIALKIPAHLEGIEAMKQIKTQKAEAVILATAIYSTEQNVLAALAGADFVAPYINRMQNNRIDAYKVIKETRKIYDDQQLKTKILAASFKNTGQIIETLCAGSHTVTIPFDLFQNMADKDLAIGAIKQFNGDASTLKENGNSHV
ncbi:transaldolase family protein [Oceanobacillus jeddahense]|uniref:transaldolase family protein n=1 Tax=Oceanobacillus jeddahense TaxID=1462527 RepID=UPI000AE05538|nr:transaldolase family protein [Oceanobacillus jeddahense]